MIELMAWVIDVVSNSNSMCAMCGCVGDGREMSRDWTYDRNSGSQTGSYCGLCTHTLVVTGKAVISNAASLQGHALDQLAKDQGKYHEHHS